MDKAIEAQNNFAAALSPRDVSCIFTGMDASIVAAHIISFNKQEQSGRQLPTGSLFIIMWLQILAGKRPVDLYRLNAD